VVTDSVEADLHLSSAGQDGKLHVLRTAPLLGQAIARICAGLPLAPLLTDWPLSGAG